MRLTAKFLLAIALTIGLVLGFTTWQNVERESALFDGDLRRDAVVTGVLLSDAFTRDDKIEGRAGADEALRQIAARTDFEVTWMRLDQIPASARASVDKGVPTSIRDDGAFPDGRLDTYILTPVRGERGALRLRSSLGVERRYLSTTQRRAVVSSLWLFAAASAAVSLLGLFLIARPTQVLVAKARRVGGGDLTQPVVLRQRDELGMLGKELNAMTDRLAEARGRIETETSGRIAAVEQLRHADRLMTVGRLASGIAHELGTPLNVIEGRARMIETGEAEGPEIAESAHIVVEQSRHVTKIVRQLLDFARRGQAARAEADLRPLVARAVQLLAGAAREAGVTLEAAVGAEAIVASIDEGQIMQVLTNLIVNGLQATPARGRVTVELDRADARVVLRVRDTGRGMDEATRERIFEPFFTTKEVGEGTGLGLSVVHGIVGDHGGTIEVDSGADRGTTFSVYLPRVTS